MTMLRIIVNEYYLYENNLVKVVGAKGMTNADTMRYLIQWGDREGRACSAEVTRRELSAAPTMERLYHDYRMALDAICAQANHLENLEAQPSLFQRVMEASKTFVERFPGGKLTFHGAARKMQEEYFEFQHAVAEYAAAKTDDSLPSEHFNSYQELRKEAAREMIDLFVTAAGLGSTIGLTWEDIEAAARETLDKLDKRTTATHQWNEDTQTVERIGKAVKS